MGAMTTTTKHGTAGTRLRRGTASHSRTFEYLLRAGLDRTFSTLQFARQPQGIGGIDGPWRLGSAIPDQQAHSFTWSLIITKLCVSNVTASTYTIQIN